MDDGADTELTMWLVSLERWWRQTSNPLYAWDAISRCLNAASPISIPEWCVPYLAEAAKNITELSGQTARREMSHDQAAKKVGNALKVTRQGANAFAQLQSDAAASRYALDAEREPKNGGTHVTIIPGPADGAYTIGRTEPWAGRTVRKIKHERNVDTDHAAKAMLRRGRKLLGLDKTS